MMKVPSSFLGNVSAEISCGPFLLGHLRSWKFGDEMDD